MTDSDIKNFNFSASGGDDDDGNDKTEVLTGEQETLNRDLQAAKEQDPCFIVIRGRKQGHRFSIPNKEMVMGRDPSADIPLPDPSVSRKHAKVLKDGDNVYLQDLGSSNGTVINGKKIPKEGRALLSKEDMIRIGNTILKFLPAGELEILVYGTLENAAHTDPLTKIYNKRYLTEALDAEFKRARALDNSLSLLFLDIDHFKKINDDHGHDAGDYILKKFCELIRKKHTRPKDIFARYGGEEFVLLLLNMNAEEAKKIAENLRLEIETFSFIYEEKRIPVTSSFGVSELKAEMDSPQTLLKAADKALYQSKNSGRNRVTVSN